MRSGKLDRRITVQALTATQDGRGDPVQSWAELDTIWAERVPQSVVQKYNSQQVYSETTAIFRTRWFPWAETIDPNEHRIRYRGRTYDIHGTEEIGRRDGLMIMTAAREDNESGTP